MTGDAGPWLVGEAGGEAKRRAPATARNREPIVEVLRPVLPDSGLALEVASGSGEHAVAFASEFRQLDWQPSDPDPACRASIAAWAAEAGLANLRAPVDLDADRSDWPVRSADAVLCINMIHISPWESALGLLAGAGRVLGPGAPLYLYGPFVRREIPTAPSNEAFDRSLRARNPAWGLRVLEDVVEEAARHGLEIDRIVEMPASNLSVILRRRHSEL